MPAGIDFSQNSRPYIVIKLSSDLHAMLVFHWLHLTPMQCFFFFFFLATVYTHAMLFLHWPQHTPTHSLFLVIILLILPTTGCIRQQHPLGSSQVKGIYCINSLLSQYQLSFFESSQSSVTTSTPWTRVYVIDLLTSSCRTHLTQTGAQLVCDERAPHFAPPLPRF